MTVTEKNSLRNPPPFTQKPIVLQRLCSTALRAAAKPSGSREQSSDKGKINLLAISRFEDLSQRLISLGCGFSCWLFKIKFVKYNSPNLMCSILIRLLPCKIYYHYTTITRAKAQKNRAITITYRSTERQYGIMERGV